MGSPAAGSADPASPCGLSLGQCSGWVGDQLIVLGGSSRIYFYFCVWGEIENPGHQPYLSFCRRHGGSCSSYHRVHLDRSPRKTAELTKSQKVLCTLDSSSRTKAAKDSIYFSPQDFGFLTNSLNSKSENFPLITSHVIADAPKNAPAYCFR